MIVKVQPEGQKDSIALCNHDKEFPEQEKLPSDILKIKICSK